MEAYKRMLTWLLQAQEADLDMNAFRHFIQAKILRTGRLKYSDLTEAGSLFIIHLCLFVCPVVRQ